MASYNDISKICLGCMEEKGDSKFCPKCGYAEGTPAESPLHLKPGTILKEHYLIGRVLGHGGFGITYLAYDINLGYKLAIKEYFPQGMATRSTENTAISVYSGNTKEQFEYGLEKFIDEGRTLARFDDIPEIVTAKDFFKENGTAYLVMSYIDGITLKKYTEQNGGKLPLDAVLTIMLTIMKALETVHNAGILHRDISPDNIYITKNFNVRLLDFGAARYAIGQHSKSMSVLLKPGYAPVEQYKTKGNQGPWTDVYAVGATIYRAITGITPPDALDRLDEDTIRKPSEMGVVIGPQYEQALMKALSVRAADRFQSMEEFESEFLKETPKDNIYQKTVPDTTHQNDQSYNNSVTIQDTVITQNPSYYEQSGNYRTVSSISVNTNSFKRITLFAIAASIVMNLTEIRSFLISLHNAYGPSIGIELNFLNLICLLLFTVFFYFAYRNQNNVELKPYNKIVLLGTALAAFGYVLDILGYSLWRKNGYNIASSRSACFMMWTLSDILFAVFTVCLILFFAKENEKLQKFIKIIILIICAANLLLGFKNVILDIADFNLAGSSFYTIFKWVINFSIQLGSRYFNTAIIFFFNLSLTYYFSKILYDSRQNNCL